MHPPQRSERKFGLGTTLAGDELDDPQQDAGTQQAGQEAEDFRATSLCTEQTENKTAQEAADDTDDDVSENAHLSIGAHDLGADPASQATDDDPAQPVKFRFSASSEQLSTFSKKCSIHTIISTDSYTVAQRL